MPQNQTHRHNFVTVYLLSRRRIQQLPVRFTGLKLSNVLHFKASAFLSNSSHIAVLAQFVNFNTCAAYWHTLISSRLSCKARALTSHNVWRLIQDPRQKFMYGDETCEINRGIRSQVRAIIISLFLLLHSISHFHRLESVQSDWKSS